MQWSLFVGAFLGAVVGVVVVLGGILVWDELERRKQRKAVQLRPSAQPMLERDLEDYIEQHFAELFPGWIIYDDAPNKTAPRSVARNKLSGRQYSTKAGVIDILCQDTEGNFVVIELKRDKAPDRVVAQVDRYMEWVKRNLAQPNQRVRG